MSEVTVESLSEEVVLEVFKWLDTKSLKNVMLTCKEWADYVRRSHQWTLNLAAARRLKGVEVILESALMANRKYNKVVIKRWTETNYGKILEIFERHGESIHEMTISHTFLTNASFWCKILNTMPNLKKVVFKWMEAVHFSVMSDDELPALHKLKILELDGDSTAALKFFKKCQLHTVTVNAFGNYLDSDLDSGHQPDKGFWNFLATQHGLKEFKLNSDICSALFETPVIEKSIPFRLKKLSVSYHTEYEISTNSINNLMEFMKWHKDTLEDLELGLKFPRKFYDFVFSEFKRLKTLSMKVKDIPRMRLVANESVTNLQLTVYGWSFYPLAPEAFVTRLPNVQKLVLNGPCDTLLAKCIADNMKQLKNLDMYAVEAYRANTFDEARLAALESLRIRQLNGRVNWDAFAKNNPSIRELWIVNVAKPIYLDVPEITRNLKLRKLTIESSELKCNEKFFEVVRQNCPELKSLELNENSLKVDISTVADIPGLRFRQF